MVRIGEYNELKVIRVVDFGVYLDDEEEGILLPKRFVPEGIQTGDSLRVFLYHDSEDRVIATTLEPKGVVGDIVKLRAVDVTQQGAFLDWGLMKDIFVPKSQQMLRMIPGGEYLVKIYIDERTGRIAATEKIDQFLSNDTLTVREMDVVDLVIYRRTDIGYLVIINNKHTGVLHFNEIYRNITAGDQFKGFIKKIYSAEDQGFVQTQVPQVEADVICACLTPALGVLLEHAWRGYTRLKQERGVVDFVDIITRLNHLLETREDLRRNVRQRFSAILVDEAQDTNRLQRRMVNLLCGFADEDDVSDRQTHSVGDPQSSARVFVVGDWKQSIYTFRGADPQSFDDFAKAVKARGGEETTLSMSRRSAPAVVRGINSLGLSLFAQRYEALAILDAEGPDAQATDAVPQPGTYWVTLPAGDKAGTKKPVKLDPVL
ncbi:MAG: hypothetical protein EOP49_18445, partial [Sphingobacteriales bacterium]